MIWIGRAAFSSVPNGGEFAFVAQTPAVGAPTVVATAKPAAAAPGQKFTITATITQGIGTVTNVSVDLRPAGLTNLAARLVLSNANVYTNTFTVSTNALLGATNLVVTAIQDTQSAIIGVGFAPFTRYLGVGPRDCSGHFTDQFIHRLCWAGSEILGNILRRATHLLQLAG